MCAVKARELTSAEIRPEIYIHTSTWACHFFLFCLKSPTVNQSLNWPVLERQRTYIQLGSVCVLNKEKVSES